MTLTEKFNRLGFPMTDAVLAFVEDLGEAEDQLNWLDALEAAGVDNWEGMDFASDIYRENN